MKNQGNRGIYRRCSCLVVLALFALSSVAYAEPADKKGKKTDGTPGEVRSLTIENKEWTGDFDQMLERRVIRVLVPYSRTLYFNDKGQERGVTADTVRDFERYLNKKYHKNLNKRHLTVVMIPQTRDALLPQVVKGMGDIAAGDITVTEERSKTVDFVSPKEGPGVNEILLTGPRSPAINQIDDLAGKTVHVRKSASYHESLAALNKRFKDGKKAPVKIVFVPDALEDEDMMEMLNAGLFEFIVVDDWVADIWAQVLPAVKVRKDIVLRSEGRIGWAIRKGSPNLEKEILEFNQKYLKKQGVLQYRLTQYHKRIKKIKNSTASAEWKRFESTIALFKKYGQKYQFDPLMLAAQGYQESTLDQKKRSPVGAVGIMQVMPATGKELRVGDIKIAENNVHAGTKYMDQLMTGYFADARFSERDRSLFAFASYNAGPGRISKMRDLAKKKGLNPDIWFNNVEITTASKVGMETTTYVRNIFKYYAAYKLSLEQREEQRKIRAQMEAVAKKQNGK